MEPQDRAMRTWAHTMLSCSCTVSRPASAICHLASVCFSTQNPKQLERYHHPLHKPMRLCCCLSDYVLEPSLQKRCIMETNSGIVSEHRLQGIPLRLRQNCFFVPTSHACGTSSAYRTCICVHKEFEYT